MESQDSPGPSAGPIDANGSEDHLSTSLVNRSCSSNSSRPDNARFGSHVDDDTSCVESREGIREEGSFGSAPLPAEASMNIARRQGQPGRGGHAVSSDDMDITKKGSNGAASVGKKSPPGF
eukprot:356073-Chlamydomonas_euryale.AAC.1